MENSVFAAIKHLSNVDPVIKQLIKKHGPCTLFEDNSLIHKPHFHVLLWAIINQQLSVASAKAIEKKLSSLLNNEIFKQKAVSRLSDEQLSSCGLSRQKIRYLKELCAAINRGEIQLNKLGQEDNDIITKTLSPVIGIGPWTIDMFLMFSLGRLNVLPLGDLALRKSIAQQYALPDQATIEDYQKIAECWQPYQSIASWYLWAAVD